ncbi:hypothetical protein VTL71DRAFT_2326 [Oculimacula yallundae]|uniref:Uncharacterized protein n=1 Tax=Oculimacula yallundae TaxID=86028 RepID=A0ABR4C8L1_9HELO
MDTGRTTVIRRQLVIKNMTFDPIQSAHSPPTLFHQNGWLTTLTSSADKSDWYQLDQLRLLGPSLRFIDGNLRGRLFRPQHSIAQQISHRAGRLGSAINI